jgi:hypothetical protein
MLGVTGWAQAPETKGPDLEGKLYRSVFSSGVGLLTPVDVERVPEPLRKRLYTFLGRWSAFKTSYKHASEDMKAVRSDAKRRVLERSIVALVDAPGVEKLAAAFVAQAPVAHEWEGMHDGPIAEAAYAENELKKDPASPLAPWLYLFIAQRQRVAFESYENEGNVDGMKAAAKKYRAFLDRARALPDPAYAAVADDMDRQPFLYIKSKGSNHPRDYNPDA